MKFVYVICACGQEQLLVQDPIMLRDTLSKMRETQNVTAVASSKAILGTRCPFEGYIEAVCPKLPRQGPVSLYQQAYVRCANCSS